MAKKRYAPQVKYIREKICLIAYPGPATGPQIAQELYGDKHKYTTLYSRYLPELKEKGYIKDMGRREGFLATPKPFLEEIERRTTSIPLKYREKMYAVLNSEAFRGSLLDTYGWVDKYKVHPYSCLLNQAGYFAIGAKEAKKFERQIRSRAFHKATNHYSPGRLQALKEFINLPCPCLKHFLNSMDPLILMILEEGGVRGIKKAVRILKS